jgi:hydrogenase maturation factor
VSAPEPSCGPHDACITCGDIAEHMRVLEIDAGRELALCAVEDGDEHATVEIGLVTPLQPGDTVLVHAGVALTVLE